MQATWEVLAEFKMTNLERGLSIMELLVAHPDGLGTSEISRLLGLPKNFVFRATSVLHLRGYLARDDAAKTFTLSCKLLSMSYHVLKHTSLIEEAMPLMRALRNRVKETVTLCAIEGAQGIVLDHVPSPHAMRLVVETGAHFQLHASAPGKAMLAFMSEPARAQLVNQLTFEKFTDTTITDPAEFKQSLHEVAQCGYAIDYGEELEGIHCVAAPILDKSGEPVAAVVVTGPVSRLKKEMLAECGVAVREMAQALSIKLGSTDAGKGIAISQSSESESKGLK